MDSILEPEILALILAFGAAMSMFWVALLNVAWAPRLGRPRSYSGHAADSSEAAPESGAANGPRVSILIPARNEARNLDRTLLHLLTSTFEDFELIVLDDGSTDESPVILKRFADQDPRVRVISGTPLPDGWLGKNWACHQLSQAARARTLLFCDADVTASQHVVGHTHRWLELNPDAMITTYPRQELESAGERLIVPWVMFYPVFFLLPLPLVPRFAFSALRAANGQWIAMQRETYDAIGGHEKVRAEIIEDMSLALQTKRSGRRLITCVTRSELSVRMYREAKEVFEGFGKNLYLLLGGKPLSFLVLWTFLFTWSALPPVVGGWIITGGTSLTPLAALLVLIPWLAALLFASLAYGQSLLLLVVHYPFGWLATAGLAWVSFWKHLSGRAQWKGRKVVQSN